MKPFSTDPVRVLLVEDEIDSARLVTRRLSRYPGAPFEMTHVLDLGSAFAKLESDDFDVMVLDLCLPDATASTRWPRRAAWPVTCRSWC